ncbi:MAG: 30S ribosomal protein S9 [Candidatus Omnitrophica bacterium CG11_big_fil_rev_8_21_14_0_20_42_13]|uniref:Small ribosomal subunit protein uS9 n=1 Tax=Candidatus Ghiorseimicrobium undicola TaxID=1974746 RepID=A0A2H0LW51_9BACT|nr:MAG: 30S ribosomal protein S9 [Candidatus Omnitrophica bacterium CG11_big_fil_rev_8_21_14_0_20_42_13]
MDKVIEYIATGRRKEAVASVRLLPGKGNILVNNSNWNKYFVRETDRIIIRQPFKATNSLDKFDCVAKVTGGGISGQAGALRHAISRALVKADESVKPVLRQGGFLTRDPRMKERKKFGRKGARKRFQWTKR